MDYIHRKTKKKLPVSRYSLEVSQKITALYSKAEVHNQLHEFTRSTKIEMDHECKRISLCGPDLTHHKADPWLLDYLNTLPFDINKDNYAQCHVPLQNYDFCLEDNWTGYFVAKYLSKQTKEQPLVFIHLDDHTDMMSTLLLKVEDSLLDSGSNTQFDPREAKDWINVINSGAVSIGSFVTALYYLPSPLHVLHLNHVNKNNPKPFYVKPNTITHPFLSQADFATIKKEIQPSVDQLGSYTGDSFASRLLSNIPLGRVIVHIDLDYFINDFNGNVGTTPEKSEELFRERALALMTKFFDTINCNGISVERWIIAASPGFCSARHWRWLLDQLSQKIGYNFIEQI